MQYSLVNIVWGTVFTSEYCMGAVFASEYCMGTVFTSEYCMVQHPLVAMGVQYSLHGGTLFTSE